MDGWPSTKSLDAPVWIPRTGVSLSTRPGLTGDDTAQRQLVRLLDDDTTFIQTEGGAVVLDLRPIVIELGDQVAVIGKVAERLPDSAGRIAIIEESQLETAQSVTKLLRAVADWMWLVALAVAALAIWLARGRRRLELRALAIGLVLVGLLTPLRG